MLAEHKMMCDLQAECGFGGCQFGGDPAIRKDTHWRTGWVPIMDADGDKLVLDLDPAPGGTSGQVFAWSNAGSTPLRLLASSFREWLAGLAEDLGKRRFGLNEHGDIWLGGMPNAQPGPAEQPGKWGKGS
jgi:cell wall assembly regulator SMI1